MTANNEKLKQLQSCQWARHVGAEETAAATCGSIEQIAGKLEADPDAFLAPPYQNPYEALCVADHQRAAQLAGRVDRKCVERMATAAYRATWKVIPVPEICGLVSDDAETLATLLLAQHELTPFSEERLAWYLRGRIPFGYLGENFPNGRWLIL